MGRFSIERNLTAITRGNIASAKMMNNFIPFQTNETIYSSGRSDFLCPRPQQYGDSLFPMSLESDMQYDVYMTERPPRLARRSGRRTGRLLENGRAHRLRAARSSRRCCRSRRSWVRKVQ